MADDRNALVERPAVRYAVAGPTLTTDIRPRRSHWPRSTSPVLAPTMVLSKLASSPNERPNERRNDSPACAPNPEPKSSGLPEPTLRGSPEFWLASDAPVACGPKNNPFCARSGAAISSVTAARTAADFCMSTPALPWRNGTGGRVSYPRTVKSIPRSPPNAPHPATTIAAGCVLYRRHLSQIRVIRG